jgi:LemA protein
MEFLFYTVIVVAIIAAFVVVMLYNRLVSLRQTCSQSLSNIDVQMKQRADLIPNLVSTVKGYAGHEKEVLENVTKARSAVQSATSASGIAAADGMMTAALGRLFAVAEAYPDLKANQNFLALQSEVSDLENKIAASRRGLNNSVAEYNAAIEQFPAVLFAKRFGFTAATMFSVTADERAIIETPPSVQF